MCALSFLVLPSPPSSPIISYYGLALGQITIKESKGRELVFMLLGGLSCYKGFISKSYELGSAMRMCSVF